MVLCEARNLAGRVDTESVTESLCVCVCETESECARTCVRGGSQEACTRHSREGCGRVKQTSGLFSSELFKTKHLVVFLRHSDL